MIIYRRNTAASISRFSSVRMSSILSCSAKQYSECFWKPGDNHNKPSSSSQSRRLFVSNLLHSFYCFQYNFTDTVTLYFHENFKPTINFKTKNGSRLITEDYAFTIIICVDQGNFLREKFGVSAYSRISTVIALWSLIQKFDSDTELGSAWQKHDV